MQHLNLTVYGRVQGVFFRASTKDKAKALGLNGWCKNQKDGTVYIEVEGPEDGVDQFVAWCNNGPESAIVDRVDVANGSLVGYSRFEIRRF